MIPRLEVFPPPSRRLINTFERFPLPCYLPIAKISPFAAAPSAESPKKRPERDR